MEAFFSSKVLFFQIPLVCVSSWHKTRQHTEICISKYNGDMLILVKALQRNSKCGMGVSIETEKTGKG